MKITNHDFQPLKKPVFNIEKIRRIDNLTKIKFQNSPSDLTRELFPMHIALHNKKNPELSTNLKDYIIVRAVTILETYFTDLIIQLIDDYKMSSHGIFDDDTLNIPIRRLDDIKQDEVTRGKIIATSCNLQDISEVNRILSKILDMDFLVSGHNNYTYPSSFRRTRRA